jgi:trans-aconitate methyltransferase
MDIEAFFTVHKGLDREGPGEPADVQWALSQIAPPRRVLDAGCGPGADLEVLAEALPKADLIGMDRYFATEAAGRTARFGARVQVSDGDMAAPPGRFDLIWCAGALYFLGVTEGLTGWRAALNPGAHVAFSEPVLLDPSNDAARAFWAEYPAITDEDGIKARIAAAGYRMVSRKLIIGAPWQRYYDPMQFRLEHLRQQDPSPALQAVIDDNQREIDLWQEGRDAIAYLLCLVTPE